MINHEKGNETVINCHGLKMLEISENYRILGLWERLHNTSFKEVDFDPFLFEEENFFKLIPKFSHSNLH